MEKKRKIKLLVILGLLLLLIGRNNKVPDYSENELIGKFPSPTGALKMYIYQGPPEDVAMVDFYVIGEIQYINKPLREREVVYYRYHDEFKECYWKDDERVVINGIEIDIKNPKTWVYDESLYYTGEAKDAFKKHTIELRDY